MKRVLYALLVLLFLALLGGTFYYLYDKSQEKPVIYASVSPFKADVIKKTVATGSISPRKEIAVKSHISGVVDKLYVEAGDLVKKNQLIARVKIIPNISSLNQAEARVKSSAINFKNAEAEYKRNKNLFDQQVISQQEFVRFKLDYELREQELEAAKDNLDIVKEGASKKEGSVSNLIYSTAEGMVLDVPVKEGAFVIESNTFNDGTTLASIADMEDLIFLGKVDESEVGKIKEGMVLSLQVGAIQDEKYDAILEHISPKGVEEEGAIQFEIKANVKLKEGTFLRSGYSANADIVLDRRDSVMVLPEAHLIFDDKSDSVFVELEVGEQQFEKRLVKTGLSDGINIEILSGVKLEDKVKELK